VFAYEPPSEMVTFTIWPVVFTNTRALAIVLPVIPAGAPEEPPANLIKLFTVIAAAFAVIVVIGPVPTTRYTQPAWVTLRPSPDVNCEFASVVSTPKIPDTTSARLKPIVVLPKIPSYWPLAAFAVTDAFALTFGV